RPRSALRSSRADVQGAPRVLALALDRGQFSSAEVGEPRRRSGAQAGGCMKRWIAFLAVLVTAALLGGCGAAARDPGSVSSPSDAGWEPLPGLSEQCGSNVCGVYHYCSTDAGPPTCVQRKGGGEPCLHDPECADWTCQPDGGCGPTPLPGGAP